MSPSDPTRSTGAARRPALATSCALQTPVPGSVPETRPKRKATYRSQAKSWKTIHLPDVRKKNGPFYFRTETHTLRKNHWTDCGQQGSRRPCETSGFTHRENPPNTESDIYLNRSFVVFNEEIKAPQKRFRFTELLL